MFHSYCCPFCWIKLMFMFVCVSVELRQSDWMQSSDEIMIWVVNFVLQRAMCQCNHLFLLQFPFQVTFKFHISFMILFWFIFNLCLYSSSFLFSSHLSRWPSNPPLASLCNFMLGLIHLYQRLIYIHPALLSVLIRDVYSSTEIQHIPFTLLSPFILFSPSYKKECFLFL